MAKAKTELNEDNKTAQSNHYWGKLGKGLMSLAVVGALGYGAWYNRAELKAWIDELMALKQDELMIGQVTDLQQQLIDLQSRLREVEYVAKNPDFSAVQKRIDDIEQISVNTIRSKADVDALLGLVVRMDNAEERLRSLSKVTDDGALILTAATLVKEAGMRGGEFVYEAEVLSEIAKGNVKVKDEVKKIEDIAALGVPSKEELQKEFIEAYVAKYPQEIEEETKATNWKERIFNKLNKMIKIRKSGEEDKQNVKKEFSEEDRAWDIVRDFVLSGEIIRAVGIAEKPLNHELLENASFKEWLHNAQIYRDFYESISRITANGLAVMKVKFLKN